MVHACRDGHCHFCRLGNGLTGGPITDAGTLAVQADGGTITVSADGIKVTDGEFVRSDHCAS